VKTHQARLAEDFESLVLSVKRERREHPDCRLSESGIPEVVVTTKNLSTRVARVEDLEEFIAFADKVAAVREALEALRANPLPIRRAS